MADTKRAQSFCNFPSYSNEKVKNLDTYNLWFYTPFFLPISSHFKDLFYSEGLSLMFYMLSSINRENCSKGSTFFLPQLKEDFFYYLIVYFVTQQNITINKTLAQPDFIDEADQFFPNILGGIFLLPNVINVINSMRRISYV